MPWYRKAWRAVTWRVPSQGSYWPGRPAYTDPMCSWHTRSGSRDHFLKVQTAQ
ncbi:hypothetical protein DPMN_070666 [Dreissena polymorpha]|uniref:Uncharacterized protein n=1 Tax=Dreissena polymorpha TaxID=45954 RepID=A0A9D3Z1E2_DREPO|nr:hypothetical protein DPMN_070666 [Dreissena polymorpha]